MTMTDSKNMNSQQTTPRTKTIRVAAVQMDCSLGQIQANADKMATMAEKALLEEGAELVVFPELSLTGYDNRQGFDHLTTDPDDPIFDRLKELSHDVGLMIGFVEERPGSLANYNSYGFLCNGEFRSVVRKIYPPTYSVHEEQKYFGKGTRLAAIDFNKFKIVPIICNDLWHPVISYLYHLMGAEVVVVPAASCTINNTTLWPSYDEVWTALIQFNALVYGSFVIFVNRVGSEAGLTFWGGSRILNPTGKILAEAPLNKEAIIVGDLDASLIRNARKYRPYHRDEDPRFARRQLEKIIHEYEY